MKVNEFVSRLKFSRQGNDREGFSGRNTSFAINMKGIRFNSQVVFESGLISK